MLDEMPCRGCGCKLGSPSLLRGLQPLDRTGDEIRRDDAVLVGEQGHEQLVSTDFFSLPFDDAYVSGRIAALHCSSDLLASGAQVSEAIANVVVPDGDSDSQVRWLRDFMAGAEREFAAMSARIVGGHTIVGPRAEGGFTVIGRPPERVWTKDALRVGDQLVLTKPLGIGVLMAAQMRNVCSAFDYQSALACMLENQFRLADRLVRYQVQAATDVTGFGLAGHLFEMLEASDVGAKIVLNRVPALPGAEQAISSGLRSSMAPANKSIESEIQCGEDSFGSARYELMFDPQTCGGLLIGVPASELDGLLRECRSSGATDAVCIGEVVPCEVRKRLLVW